MGRAGRGTAPLHRRGPRPPSQSPVHFLGLQPVAYTRCLKYVLFDRQLSQQPSYSPATVGWVARGRARVWGRSVRREGGGQDGPRSAAGRLTNPRSGRRSLCACRVPTTRLLPASVLRVHGLCLRFHELRAREPCCVPKGQVSVEPCAGARASALPRDGKGDSGFLDKHACESSPRRVGERPYLMGPCQTVYSSNSLLEKGKIP